MSDDMFGPPPRRRVDVYRAGELIFSYGGQPPDERAETSETAVSAPTASEPDDEEQG